MTQSQPLLCSGHSREVQRFWHVKAPGSGGSKGWLLSITKCQERLQQLLLRLAGKRRSETDSPIHPIHTHLGESPIDHYGAYVWVDMRRIGLSGAQCRIMARHRITLKPQGHWNCWLISTRPWCLAKDGQSICVKYLHKCTPYSQKIALLHLVWGQELLQVCKRTGF